MISRRCKIIVRDELEKLNLNHLIVDLGVVQLLEEISKEQLDLLRINLSKSGLELLDDPKGILVERIKKEIIELIHFSDELPKVSYSTYLSERLDYNYIYLSTLFTEVKGITIQHYIILHKIERVKELLLYDELTLTEISYKLHYSSAAHLSNQFKKITGVTPSYYRRLKQKRTKNLEDI